LFGIRVATLLLAASGIFAVLSYAVASRTREFGVRIALGANPGRVLWHVLREGMVFPIAGLAIGIAASLAATRLLQASLYGISPQEPVFAGTGAPISSRRRPAWFRRGVPPAAMACAGRIDGDPPWRGRGAGWLISCRGVGLRERSEAERLAALSNARAKSDCHTASTDSIALIATGALSRRFVSR
jgi:hypothetical protein